MKSLGLGHAAAQGQSQENPVSRLRGCRAASSHISAASMEQGAWEYLH